MEQNSSTPQQTEPASTDSAITNLRGALDSIARTDLNIPEVKENSRPDPSKHPGSYEQPKQEAKEEVNQGAVESNESSTESSTESNESNDSEEVKDSTPTEDKAKIRWKELKQAESDLKVAQKELAELKRRGEESQQQANEVAELKSQIEDIKAEREAIDSELYLTRVQSTREWKQYITEPLNGIISDVEFFAQRNKTEPGVLIDALQADSNGDPSKLEQAIADWSERDKTKVWALADNLLQIEKRKSEIEANSKSAYEASMQRHGKEQQENQAKYFAQRETAISDVLPKVAEKVFNLLPEDKRPNTEELKKEIMQYDSWPENLKVYGILGATVLPDLIEQINTLQSQLKETKENNVKIRSASPSIAGGTAPRSPQETKKSVDYTKLDTDDFVKSLVSRMSV